MNLDNLYTARWAVLNDKPVPGGGPKEALLDSLRPRLGPEPSAEWVEEPREIEWLFDDSWPVVGHRFSVDEFDAYVSAHERPSWGAMGVTIHNTASPSLDDRPDGFEVDHMRNLRHYYKVKQGWSAGPHLFVDDHGIWVFTPLSLPGVHSPSFNHTRIGIEMLGAYSTRRDFDNPRSASVFHNAQAAAAILLRRFAFGPQWLNFHRHDPETSHRDCPGSLIDFTTYEASMLEIYHSLA